MLNRTKCVLTIACVAILMLAMPASSQAGCDSCAAPIVAAPAYAAYYAPQAYAYMPTPIYRTYYRPAVVTAYQPVYQPAVPYTAAYTGYAVTTYRPLFGWGYQTRLVPYTTYRPVYTAMPLATYSGCNTCVNYSPCESCGPSGAVSYAAPASGCSSCTATPATVVSPAPLNGSSESAPATNAAPQKTFQETTGKPVAEPELKPIPQPETRFNSNPSPRLPDPKDRSASRPSFTSARTVSVASPIQPAATQNNDGWQPARD